MSDDKTHIGSPDRDPISWTTSLGVSEGEFHEAVDAIGNSAEKVRKYVRVG